MGLSQSSTAESHHNDYPRHAGPPIHNSKVQPNQHENFMRHYYPTHQNTHIQLDDLMRAAAQKEKQDAAKARAAEARERKAAADALAAPYTSDEVDIRNSKVFCSGPYKDPTMGSNTITLHFYNEVDRKLEVAPIKRWTQFRFIHEIPIPQTLQYTRETCLIVLEKQDQMTHQQYSILWSVFKENFTPFSKEESMQGKRGNRFDGSHWKGIFVPGISTYRAPPPPVHNTSDFEEANWRSEITE